MRTHIAHAVCTFVQCSFYDSQQGSCCCYCFCFCCCFFVFLNIFIFCFHLTSEKNMWRMNKRYHVFILHGSVCMLFDWCVVCFAQTRIYQSHHKCNRRKKPDGSWMFDGCARMSGRRWSGWADGRTNVLPCAGCGRSERTLVTVCEHIKNQTTNENYSL